MPSWSHQVGLSAIGHFSPSLVAGKLLTFGKCLVEDDRLVLGLGHEQGRPRNHVGSPLGCSRRTISPHNRYSHSRAFGPRPRPRRLHSWVHDIPRRLHEHLNLSSSR